MVKTIEKLRELRVGFRHGPKPFAEGKPTLVMVHGAGGHSIIWQYQIHGLKDACNTLALDLPGHGETHGPPRSRIADYAAWLARLLGEAFEQPPFLMGHSMGGAIVQETAMGSSAGVLRGLVLAGTAARLQVAPAFLEGMASEFEKSVDAFIGYAYAKETDPQLVREGARLMKEAGPEVMQADFLACDRFDRRREVAALDLPCLILCGEQDKLTPPALSESLNRSLKGSELRLLTAAGHMAMIEAPDAFNQAVRNFIRRLG